MLRNMTEIKPIEEYESFKTAIQNLIKNSNRTRVSKHTEINYKQALKQYLRFVNSEEDLKKQLNPDDLIEEARSDTEKTKDKIRLFFLWLQNQDITGFKSRGKSMRATSACVRAYAQIKGFYTNNDIIFGKWKTPSLADMTKEAIENDTSTPFFKLDIKKRKVFLDRALLKQFLANLKLRDQTIFLAMLSSSHDGGDLFKLNVGDMNKQKERERFYWEGQRGKTGIRFKTFFTVEATNFIRRYIQQERRDAKDDEPLFVTTEYSGEKHRMESQHISNVFRESAKKMGIEFGNGYQNPFRPKRLRHIFRTACTHSHIDEGYINAFMGHKTDQSKQYLEKDITILELEFSKAEPLLTIYGVVGIEGLESIQTELTEWKSKYADLKVKVDDLESQLNDLSKALVLKVEKIARHVYEDLPREIGEMKRAQQEFIWKQIQERDQHERATKE